MSKPASQKIRDGFTFFRSFRDAVEMTDKSDQLVLYKAIADYALDGKEPDISTMGALGRLCWTAISPGIKSGRTRFENGCGGGAPKGNQNAKKQPQDNPKEVSQCVTPKQPKNNLNSTEKQPNTFINENENENENVKRKGDCKGEADKPHPRRPKRTAFVPPSLEELRAFVSEHGLTNVNPETFIDHYEANGWRAGRNPMKDWKAAARNWNRWNREFTTTTAKAEQMPQPRYAALC